MADYTRLGGFVEMKRISPSVILDVAKLRDQILENISAPTVDMFDVISQASQVVAGTKYIIKIQTGPIRFIHVKYLKKLDGSLSLISVDQNKTLLDGLI